MRTTLILTILTSVFSLSSFAQISGMSKGPWAHAGAPVTSYRSTVPSSVNYKLSKAIQRNAEVYRKEMHKNASRVCRGVVAYDGADDSVSARIRTSCAGGLWIGETMILSCSIKRNQVTCKATGDVPKNVEALSYITSDEDIYDEDADVDDEESDLYDIDEEDSDSDLGFEF